MGYPAFLQIAPVPYRRSFSKATRCLILFLPKSEAFHRVPGKFRFELPSFTCYSLTAIFLYRLPCIFFIRQFRYGHRHPLLHCLCKCILHGLYQRMGCGRCIGYGIHLRGIRIDHCREHAICRVRQIRFIVNRSFQMHF